MKKKILLSLFFIGFFVTMVLVKMPAAFVLYKLSEQTRAFSLSHVQGSLFHASASNVQVRLPNNPARKRVLMLGEVSWNIHLLSLLTGNLTLELDAQHPDQSVSGVFSLSLGKVLSLENATIKANVADIKAFVPSPGKAEGRVELSLASAEIDLADLLDAANAKSTNKLITPTVSNLSGQALVQGLAINFRKQVSLGDFGVQLSQEGDTLLADVTDLESAVGVDAKLSFNQAEKNYSVNATIKPSAEANPNIAGALKFVAKQQADQSFQINYSDTL